MSSFRNPQDLLLHLSQALETHLDRKIAPSDHHATRRPLHRVQEHVRQVLEPSSRFDLEHDARPARAQALEVLQQQFYVARAIDERQLDHIRVLGDEFEILEVLDGQALEAKLTIGEVDPLVSSKLHTAVATMSDPNPDPAGLHVLDHATDLAVVELNRFSHADIVEHLRNRAADPRRRKHATRAVQPRGLADLQVPRHEERVPFVHNECALRRRQLAHHRRATSVAQYSTGDDAGFLAELRPQAGVESLHREHSTLGVTCVGEAHLVPCS